MILQDEELSPLRANLKRAFSFLISSHIITRPTSTRTSDYLKGVPKRQ